MDDLIHKIQKFNLNLEYPIKNIDLEIYTNYLINQRMNEFFKLFKNSRNKIFILDYKDDLISLICYRIIKNLQSINSFNIAIYGKINNTKKYLVKKEKRICKLKLNRLIKQNKAIIISPYNPIYKVIKKSIVFKDYPTCSIWKPLERFTPDQIKQAQIFYHLGYIQKDRIQLDEDPQIKELNDFCYDKNKRDIDIISKEYYNDIALVKLTGNNEKDQLLLNKIENFDGLVFYYYDSDNNKPELLDSNFPMYLKNKANIPDKGNNNINNYKMPEEIELKYGVKKVFIRDWEE